MDLANPQVYHGDRNITKQGIPGKPWLGSLIHVSNINLGVHLLPIWTNAFGNGPRKHQVWTLIIEWIFFLNLDVFILPTWYFWTWSPMVRWRVQVKPLRSWWLTPWSGPNWCVSNSRHGESLQNSMGFPIVLSCFSGETWETSRFFADMQVMHGKPRDLLRSFVVSVDGFTWCFPSPRDGSQELVGLGRLIRCGSQLPSGQCDHNIPQLYVITRLH